MSQSRPEPLSQPPSLQRRPSPEVGRASFGSCALLAGLFLALGVQEAGAGTAVEWDGDGGDGLWTTAANWNPDVVPDNGPGSTYDVTIPPFAGTVVLAGDVNVDNLFVGTGSELSITAGRLRVENHDGQFHLLENDGTISFSGSGPPEMELDGPITYRGDGVFRFAATTGSGYRIEAGPLSSSRLTIEAGTSLRFLGPAGGGTGKTTFGPLHLESSGEISWTNLQATLIAPSEVPGDPTSRWRLSGNAVLAISDGSAATLSGHVLGDGPGTVVRTEADGILDTGGTFEALTLSGGVFLSGATLRDTRLGERITVPANRTATLATEVAFGPGSALVLAEDARVEVDGAVTLSNTGELEVTGDGARVTGACDCEDDLLTLTGFLDLTGAGRLTIDVPLFVDGVTVESTAADATITLDHDDVIVSGELRVSSGKLRLARANEGHAFQNADGLISTTGGTLELAARIVGGTVLGDVASLGATFENVDLLGTVTVPNGSAARLAGSFDGGTFRLLGTSSTTELAAEGTVSLTGTTILELGEGSGNRILGEGFDVAGTLEVRSADPETPGKGQLWIGSNHGTITVSGVELFTIWKLDVNAGVVMAGDASTVDHNATTDNTGGTLCAEGGTLRLLPRDVTGGTVSSESCGGGRGVGGTVLAQGVRLDGPSLHGLVTIPDGFSMTVRSGLQSDGEVRVGGTTAPTTLWLDGGGGDLALAGGGSIVLESGVHSRVTSFTGTHVTNVDHTIRGHGSFSADAGLLNLATILADGAEPLAFATPGDDLVNEATLAATGAGGIEHSGSGLVNRGGLSVAAGSAIDAGTLELEAGTASIAGAADLSSVALTGGSLFYSSADRIANVTLVSGVLSNGPGVGALEVDATFFMGEEGRLDVDLGGYAVETEHDILRTQITGFGSTTLDGTLFVRAVDGFEPQVGDEFAILSSGISVPDGNFHTVTSTTPVDFEVQVGFPGADLVAIGPSTELVFVDGFESGDTALWSGGGRSHDVASPAAVRWAVDRLPDDPDRFLARLHLDLESLLGEAVERHLEVRDAWSDRPILVLGVLRGPTGPELVLPGEPATDPSGELSGGRFGELLLRSERDGDGFRELATRWNGSWTRTELPPGSSPAGLGLQRPADE